MGNNSAIDVTLRIVYNVVMTLLILFFKHL